MDIARLLRETALFTNLDDDELEAVAKCVHEESFASGETIIEEGTPGDALYIVRHGRVKVDKVASDKRLALAELGPSEAFGEMSLLDSFLYAIPAGATLSIAAALWWARKLIFDDVVAHLPEVGRSAWKDLKKLRLRQTTEMVHLRITSLFAMASDVFMKRIRSLVDSSAYGDPEYKGTPPSNTMGTRLIANYIIHLTAKKWPPKNTPSGAFEDVREWTPPLRAVAYVAATMPSTLWWDDDKPYELPCLVAAGQATMCFNLMKWITRNHGADSNEYPAELKALWDTLVEDWARLCEEPYALLADGMGREKPPSAPSPSVTQDALVRPSQEGTLRSRSAGA